MSSRIEPSCTHERAIDLVGDELRCVRCGQMIDVDLGAIMLLKGLREMERKPPRRSGAQPPGTARKEA
jgi:hypothetical protein